MKKAKTAIFFQMNTEVVGSLSQPGGDLFNIEHSNSGLITFPGGIPLNGSNGALCGGVGVSGSSVVNDKIVQNGKQIIGLIQVQNADKKLTAVHILGMDCEDLDPPNAHVRICTDYIKN